MRLKAQPFLVVAAIGFISCSAALADEKSHRKAAEDLLKIMGIEDQLTRSIDQSIDIQIKANPQIEPFREVMKKFFTKHLSWAGLKEDLIGIYTDAFTEEELKQIKAFYETPAGKRMAEKMPELTSKGMQLGVARVQANQAELQQMIQEEAKKPK